MSNSPPGSHGSNDFDPRYSGSPQSGSYWSGAPQQVPGQPQFPGPQAPGPQAQAPAQPQAPATATASAGPSGTKILIVAAAVFAVVALAGAVSWAVSNDVGGSGDDLIGAATESDPDSADDVRNTGDLTAPADRVADDEDDEGGLTLDESIPGVAVDPHLGGPGDCINIDDLDDPVVDDCLHPDATDMITWIDGNLDATMCMEFDGVEHYLSRSDGTVICLKSLWSDFRPEGMEEFDHPANSIERGECITVTDYIEPTRADCREDDAFVVDRVIPVNREVNEAEEAERICAEEGSDADLAIAWGLTGEEDDSAPDPAFKIACLDHI